MGDMEAMLQPRCWCLRPKGRRSMATNRLAVDDTGYRSKWKMELRTKTRFNDANTLLQERVRKIDERRGVAVKRAAGLV
jgi:hypothetical protein